MSLGSRLSAKAAEKKRAGPNSSSAGEQASTRGGAPSAASSRKRDARPDADDTDTYEVELSEMVGPMSPEPEADDSEGTMSWERASDISREQRQQDTASRRVISPAPRPKRGELGDVLGAQQSLGVDLLRVAKEFRTAFTETPEEREKRRSIRRQSLTKEEEDASDIQDVDADKLRLAGAYVRDALAGRLDHGEASMLDADVITRRAFYIQISPLWGKFVYITALVQLLSVFTEPACYREAKDMPDGRVYHVFWSAWSEKPWHEIVFLSVFYVDTFMKMRYLGGLRSYISKKWHFRLFLVIVIMTIDVLQNFLFDTRLQFSRALRPVFIVIRHRDLRRVLDSILSMIPDLLNIMVSFLLFISFFAVMGVRLFEGLYSPADVQGGIMEEEAFDNFWYAFQNLFALTTTENYPTVMYPAFNSNGFSFLFFLIFILIGVYFLMALILATVEAAYREFHQHNVVKEVKKERKALCKAFDLIDPKGTGYITRALWLELVKAIYPGASEDIEQAIDEYVPSAKARIQQRKGQKRASLRTKDDVEDPSGGSNTESTQRNSAENARVLHVEKKAVQFNADERGSSEVDRDDLLADVPGDKDLKRGSGSFVQVKAITRQLTRQVSMAARNAAKRMVGRRAMPNKMDVRFQAIDKDDSGCVSIFEFFLMKEVLNLSFKERFLNSDSEGKFRKWCHKVVSFRGFEDVVFFLIVANLLQQAMYYRGISSSFDEVLNAVDNFFLFVFVVEMIVRIGDSGLGNYLGSKWNRVDFVVIAVSLIVRVVGFAISVPRAWEGVSVFRAARLVRRSRRVKFIANVFYRVAPMSLSFLLFVFLTMYAYGIIGMEIMWDKFGTATSYIAENPEATFDSFEGSMLTLFQVLTTSEWPNIYNAALLGLSDEDERFIFVFFQTYYIIQINIIVNLLIALTIVAHKIERKKESKGSGKLRITFPLADGTVCKFTIRKTKRDWRRELVQKSVDLIDDAEVKSLQKIVKCDLNRLKKDYDLWKTVRAEMLVNNFKNALLEKTRSKESNAKQGSSSTSTLNINAE